MLPDKHHIRPLILFIRSILSEPFKLPPSVKFGVQAFKVIPVDRLDTERLDYCHRICAACKWECDKLFAKKFGSWRRSCDIYIFSMSLNIALQEIE